MMDIINKACLLIIVIICLVSCYAQETGISTLHLSGNSKCNVVGFLGTTLFAAGVRNGIDVCYRVEFYKNGRFVVDNGNPNCLNDTFQVDTELGIFQSFEENKAFYENNYAEFRLLQNPNVDKLFFQVVKNVPLTIDILLPFCAPTETGNESSNLSRNTNSNISVVPSSQPSVDFCTNKLKDKFELVMTTDNKPTETRFDIFVLENGAFKRSVFSKDYPSAVVNHSTTRCLFRVYCFKLVVYDEGGDGLCCEHGEGSYQVYWNGECQLVLHD